MSWYFFPIECSIETLFLYIFGSKNSTTLKLNFFHKTDKDYTIHYNVGSSVSFFCIKKYMKNLKIFWTELGPFYYQWMFFEHFTFEKKSM